MNHYLIRYKVVRDTFLNDATETEQQIVGQHFEYLQKMMAEKKLIIAGRTEDAEIGIAVILADSDSEASEILQNDPAVKNGIFEGSVKLFRLALWQNDA